MKKYYFLLLLIFSYSSSHAAELVIPLLTPKTVIEKTKKYLAKEKAIDLNKYQLKSIIFNYFNQSSNRNGTSVLDYSCKPTNNIQTTDCGFTVRIDNSTDPRFEFRPISV